MGIQLNMRYTTNEVLNDYLESCRKLGRPSNKAKVVHEAVRRYCKSPLAFPEVYDRVIELLTDLQMTRTHEVKDMDTKARAIAFLILNRTDIAVAPLGPLVEAEARNSD